MTVTVREATPDDAGALIAFVQQLSEEPDIDIIIGPGEFKYTVEQERDLLANYATSENSVYLVAEADGQIVGVLDCHGSARKRIRHATTLGISVRRDWRGRGVGNALMARAVEWAKSTGVVTRIELQVYARNARGIHLYEKYGFQVEGRLRRAIYREGEYLDNLVMALLL